MCIFKNRDRLRVHPKTSGASLAVLLLVCFFALNQAAHGDSAWSDLKTAKLDKYLEALAQQKMFNGAVLMAEGGEVVYEKYNGFADLNEDTKVLSPRSSFRLASVSKQFTAMAIMILMEQGKLNLDDDMQAHLPSLPYKGITIRHLLHHNSGLPSYEEWFGEHWDSEEEFEDRKTAYNSDVVEQFSLAKPAAYFEPGEEHEYSNTGYVFLAQIVENASGVPIRQFLQDEIFSPLNMNDTQAFSPAQDFNVSERVYGFKLLADGLSYEEHDWTFLNGMIGDGGIYSSARDLLKWDQAWYGEQIVSQETIEEAYVSGRTNQGEITGYGFGWALQENQNGKVTHVMHSGSWVGFQTLIQRDLKKNRTAIVLTNNSGDGYEHILQGLGQLYLGQELRVPPENVNHELAEIIESDGVNAAIARFNEIKQSENKHYFITDELIQELSDFYFDAGQPELSDALEELIDRPKIVLAKKQLQAYVGTYTLTESFIIDIFRRGSGLFAQATNQAELQLKPLLNNRFKVIGVDAEISFTRNEEGLTESLTLHQNGLNQIAEKTSD